MGYIKTTLFIGILLLVLFVPTVTFGQIGGAKVSNFIIEFKAPYTSTDIEQIRSLGANVTAQFKLIPAVAATFSEDLVSVLKSFAHIKAIHPDKVLRIAQVMQTFENFDNTSDWIVINGALTSSTLNSPVPGGSFAGLAEIDSSKLGTTNAFEAEKFAATSTNPRSISWYFHAKAPDTPGGGDILFSISDAIRNAVAFVRLNAAGVIYVSDNVGAGKNVWVNAGPFTQNTWSMIAISNINWSARTADLIVDGTKRTAFRLLPGTGFGLFSIQSPISFMIDEITLVQEESPLPQPTTWNIPRIRAPEVWAEGVTGSGQAVCLIDTGVNAGHPALYGKVLAQIDLINGDLVAEDENGHGTHIAGIIASSDTNVPGVAPSAGLVVAKACNSAGDCRTSDIMTALEWCTGSAIPIGSGGAVGITPPPSPLPKVVEMALGGIPPAPFGSCDEDILAHAANNAVDEGFTVVAATGNLGHLGITTPGCASRVIAVGASDKNDRIPAFSSRGQEIDLVAPGVDIVSLDNDFAQFTSMSGTSQASAHVAGAAALLLQSNPKLSPSDVKISLKDTAEILPSESKKAQGDGRLDSYLAYRHASGQSLSAPAKIDLLTPLVVLKGDQFSVGAFVRNPSSSPLIAASLNISQHPQNISPLEGVLNPTSQILAISDVPGRFSFFGSVQFEAASPGVVQLTAQIIPYGNSPVISEKIFILPREPVSVFDAIVNFFRNIFFPPSAKEPLVEAQNQLAIAASALQVNNTALFTESLRRYEQALNATANAISSARAASQNVTQISEEAGATVRTNIQLLTEFLIRAPSATTAAVTSAINTANGFLQKTAGAVPVLNLTTTVEEINRLVTTAPFRQSLAHRVEDLIKQGTATLPPPDPDNIRLALAIIRGVKAELFSRAEAFISDLNVTAFRQRVTEEITRTREAASMPINEASRMLNLSTENIRSELIRIARAATDIIILEVDRGVNASKPAQPFIIRELARQIELIDGQELERAINQTNLSGVMRDLISNISNGAPTEVTDSLVKELLLKLLQVIRTLEDFKLSIVESFLDFTPPAITNMRVSPDPVGPGRNVTISFSINEPLIQSPIVFVGNESEPKIFSAAYLASSGSVCSTPPSQFLRAQNWAFNHRVSPGMDLAQLTTDLDLINRSFNVNQLGVPSQTRFIRIPVHWYKVEPQQGVFDESAITFYKNYIQQVREKGFEPILLLGTPTPGPLRIDVEEFLGAPKWALKLLLNQTTDITIPSPPPVPPIFPPKVASLSTTNVNSFVDEFGKYVRKVAQEFGANVDLYNIWNEPNAYYSFLPEPVDVLLFKKSRQELNAVDPGAQIIVNVLEVGLAPFGIDWRAALAFYLANANESIDIIALDYYSQDPRALVGIDPRDWSLLEELFFIGGVTGKKIAITETGFNTQETIPFHFNPKGQQNWINFAIPAMLSKIGELSSGVPIPPLTNLSLPLPLLPYSPPPFLFASYWEVYDRGALVTPDFDPESKFGIFTKERVAKNGADDLRYYINAPTPAGTSSSFTGDSGCTYNYILTIPTNIPRGERRATAFVSAIDRAQAALVGNEGNATASFLIDALPPSVENVTANPFYTGTENVTITFDVNESVGGEPTVIVQDSAGTNKTAVFVSTTGGKNPRFVYRYEVTAVDAEGNATIFVFASDLAGNVGEGRGKLVLKDKDADGIFDSRDVCPTTPGTAERQGCVLGDLTKVKLHIVDQAKRGDCGLDRNGRAIPTCKKPLENVSVKIFDRDDPAFIAAYGRDPRKTLLPTIFESGIGWLGNTTPMYQRQGASCITNASGRCVAGDPKEGLFIVITKYTDPETGRIVYAGKNKRVEDFNQTEEDDREDDDKPADFQPKLAHKSIKILKTIKRDGTVDLKASGKTIVVGSMLEVIAPDYAIWSKSNEVYPFLFTSDSNWTVDICVQLPAGYKILATYNEEGNLVSNASCTQAFVAGETKAALFEAVAVGSPQPDAKVTIKTTSPENKVTTLALDVPGERVEKAAIPLFEVFLLAAAGAGVASLAVAVVRRRRKGSFAPPMAMEHQPWQQEVKS